MCLISGVTSSRTLEGVDVVEVSFDEVGLDGSDQGRPEAQLLAEEEAVRDGPDLGEESADEAVSHFGNEELPVEVDVELLEVALQNPDFERREHLRHEILADFIEEVRVRKEDDQHFAQRALVLGALEDRERGVRLDLVVVFGLFLGLGFLVPFQFFFEGYASVVGEQPLLLSVGNAHEILIQLLGPFGLFGLENIFFRLFF